MVAYRKDAADEEGNGEQRQAAQKAKLLADLGVELIPVNADEEGHVDLRELMKILGEKKIDSILLEGGGELNFSALKAGDRLLCAGVHRAEDRRRSRSEVSGRAEPGYRRWRTVFDFLSHG